MRIVNIDFLLSAHKVTLLITSIHRLPVKTTYRFINGLIDSIISSIVAETDSLSVFI